MNSKGFTLMEVMITVVIIGILAAIAWPIYQDTVIQTNRTQGTSLLLETAQTLERCFTRFQDYNDANCSIIDGDTVTANGDATIDGDELYSVTVDSDATTYTLTAAPQAFPQTEDTECGSLTLNQAGVRGETGSLEVADCW